MEATIYGGRGGDTQMEMEICGGGPRMGLTWGCHREATRGQQNGAGGQQRVEGVTSHIQRVRLGGEGGAPRVLRDSSRGRGHPPLPPRPQMLREGGVGGGHAPEKCGAAEVRVTAPGVPDPPGSQSVGTSPPYTPIWGGVLTAVILGGGGGVIRSATLGVCPPPFCH